MSSGKLSNGSIAGAICQKCHTYRYYRDLIQDGAFPGLHKVCRECYDYPSPYLLPPLQPDPLILKWPTPFVKLVAPQYADVPVYGGGIIETGNIKRQMEIDSPEPFESQNDEYIPPSLNRKLGIR